VPTAVSPLAIAHRGDPVAHRENTVAAVVAAIEQGADAIEVDVQLAADGTVVVVHDDTFARLWDDPRPVAALTWPEIALLGDGDERVPRLAELLEIATDAGVPLVLDQKHPIAALPALRVVRGARADGTAFCGSTEGLLEVREAAPGATIYFNDAGLHLPDVRLLAQLRPQYYNPYYRLLAPATVDAMAAFGIRTCCWTPNTDAELNLVLDLGVDAVMTDRVGPLRTILADRVGPLRTILAGRRG
jgi:glycerophosphoryl diester phosphodiesterase